MLYKYVNGTDQIYTASSLPNVYLWLVRWKSTFLEPMVKCRSFYKGEGATFYIMLPLQTRWAHTSKKNPQQTLRINTKTCTYFYEGSFLNLP
jgi:hypothetical protein